MNYQLFDTSIREPGSWSHFRTMKRCKSSHAAVQSIHLEQMQALLQPTKDQFPDISALVLYKRAARPEDLNLSNDRVCIRLWIMARSWPLKAPLYENARYCINRVLRLLPFPSHALPCVNLKN